MGAEKKECHAVPGTITYLKDGSIVIFRIMFRYPSGGKALMASEGVSL